MNLVDIAKDTLNAIERGYVVRNDKASCYEIVTHKGTYINNRDAEKICLVMQQYLQFEKKESMYAKYFVVPTDVITTILNLSEQSRTGKIGVLNFASAMNPGGGFKNGAKAQEEAICYCSNLYETLKDSQFYRHQKAVNGIEAELYANVYILSNVRVFKDAAFNYLAIPRDVVVVSSAAVNLNRVNPSHLNYVKPTMKERMRDILAIFANAGVKDIVLGAFGCGVFGNNPNVIANLWFDLLEEEGFAKYFDTVVFSVLVTIRDTKNYIVFRDVCKERVGY